MTNRQRIHLAHVAILASHADHDPDASPEEALMDLLANLWHYADHHGLEFTNVLESAAYHHAFEAKLGLEDRDVEHF
jgi:hypothetical protein